MVRPKNFLTRKEGHELCAPCFPLINQGFFNGVTKESIIKKTYASGNLPPPLFAKEG
jgi:hypothetical protein